MTSPGRTTFGIWPGRSTWNTRSGWDLPLTTSGGSSDRLNPSPMRFAHSSVTTSSPAPATPHRRLDVLTVSPMAEVQPVGRPDVPHQRAPGRDADPAPLHVEPGRGPVLRGLVDVLHHLEPA